MSQKIKKYLGIDWGKVRIGLALGDSEGKLATPLKTVNNIEEILDIVNEENINEIVVGEPIKMNSENEIQKVYIDFVKDLAEKVHLPLHQVDERLTSKAADALPGDKKNKADRDAIAAMLILQSYLDSL